ncbi:MAG: hypothetical protein L0Z53_17370 [Acidobacteriales bacterium]|nr:hypothetical protein [Terriglobales bacterium]
MKMPDEVRDKAQAMLRDPNLVERVIDDVADCGVAGERDLIATVYVIGTSRLLPEPLGAIVQAPTSTGKSFVVEKTAKFFPPETNIHATAITAQALYYMPPGSLSHQFVVAGERSRYHDDQSADATKALRELRSSGRLSKLVTETKGGRQATRRVEQEGPIAYIETTTAPNIFAEDANRCLILTTDESSNQTRLIIHRIAAGGNGDNRVAATVEKHYAIQRMLQQRPVVVPYSDRLASLFPVERPEARRSFGQLLSMVQALALLHQFQRETDAEGRIVADLADYEVARRLCGKPLGRSLGGQISDGAIRFYKRLVKAYTGISFTTTEGVRHTNLSRQTTNDYLWELSGVGAVEQIEERRGSKPAVWMLEKVDWDNFFSSMAHRNKSATLAWTST